ncbi:hypothetical protein HXX76_014127 [Chlamydomonas incerta]|uniref:Uncharacterized protein n=1 Tax=Chlamydomonas incerta TaxID=51695 RepID=A0A835SMH6_CHLIN|nr:hypothetical protein HXX76_014127 [Chlamydomonas incerta]|eukprot:KAG2424969.1 hypothetical protein HXX76_014127 [Chlamydomonas incerta]
MEATDSNKTGVCLIGAMIQFMPASTSLALAFDAMQGVGCITADDTLRFAAMSAIRAHFTAGLVSVDPLPVMQALWAAECDRDALLRALAPLEVFRGTPKLAALGCELLLWLDQKKQMCGRMQWHNLVTVIDHVCDGCWEAARTIVAGMAQGERAASDPREFMRGMMAGATERGSVPVLKAAHHLLGGHAQDPHLQERLLCTGFMGHTEMLRYLHRECGMDCGVNNGQLLLDAAQQGFLDTVQYLHEEAGLDCGHMGGAAIPLAAHHGYNEALVLYLCIHAGIECAAQYPILMYKAALWGNIELMRTLHERGGMDCGVEDGLAMVTAAAEGHIELVQYLHRVETVAQLACSMGLPNVRHLNLGACCQWAQTSMSALYPEMATAMPHLQSIEVPLTSCVRGLEALAGLTSVRAVPAHIHMGTPLLIADARSLVQLPNLQRLELCLSTYGPRHRLQEDEWQHGGLAHPEDAAALSGAADPCIKEQLYALRMLAASAPKKLERISIAVLSADEHCTMYDAHITLQEGRVCSVALGTIQGTLRTANYLAAALLPVVAASPTGRLRSLSADSLYNMDRTQTLRAPEGLLARAHRWVQARMAAFLVDAMLFASAALTNEPLAPWARARMPRPCETLQGFWDGFHQVPRCLEEKVAFFLKLTRLHRKTLLDVLSEIAADAHLSIFGRGEAPREWAGARLACRQLRDAVDASATRARLALHIDADIWEVSPLARMSGRNCDRLEVVLEDLCTVAQGQQLLDGMVSGVPTSVTFGILRLELRVWNVDISRMIQRVCGMVRCGHFENVRHLQLGACSLASKPLVHEYRSLAAAVPHLQILELPMASCIRGVEALQGLRVLQVTSRIQFMVHLLSVADARSLQQLPHLNQLSLSLGRRCMGLAGLAWGQPWDDAGLARLEDADLLSEMRFPAQMEQFYALRLLIGSPPKSLRTLHFSVLSHTDEDLALNASVGFSGDGRVHSIDMGDVHGLCGVPRYLAAVVLPVLEATTGGCLQRLTMNISCDNDVERRAALYRRLRVCTHAATPLARLARATKAIHPAFYLRLPHPFEGGRLLPDARATLTNIVEMLGFLPTCISFQKRGGKSADQGEMLITNQGLPFCGENPSAVRLTLSGVLVSVLAQLWASWLVWLLGTRIGRHAPRWALRRCLPGRACRAQRLWLAFNRVPQPKPRQLDFLFVLARLHRELHQNYRRHLTELPIEPYLASGTRLFEWTVLLHNTVNRELGKPEWTLAQARSVHQAAPADLAKIGWGVAGAVAAVTLLALLLGFAVKFVKKTKGKVR